MRKSAFIRNGWYCAGFSEEFEQRPFGRTFLDESVLLFRKQDGAPAALSDVCPHRFAPLHRGTLEGDVIHCPYHGLAFDSAGHCVHNPHGSGRIPPRSDVRVYPLVERQGVVWIWMGDTDEADPGAIVDLRLVRDGAPPRVTGYSLMPTDYRLIIDNLLDLNHAPYLHSGGLSPVGKTRETRAERGPITAASHYLMRSVETPASQQLWFDQAVGDYHVSIDWTAPSTLRQFISMTEENASPEVGALTRGAHLLTPESATSTHYFWVMTRNRRVDDAAFDAKLKSIIENAFQTEDGPMISACQSNMRGRDFNELRPIFLETDAAPGHARSVTDRLLRRELESSTEPQA